MPRPQFTVVTPPIQVIHNRHLPKSQHLNQTQSRQRTRQSLPMNSRQASCFTPTLPKKHTRMIFYGEPTARHWRKKSFMTRNREWFLLPPQREVCGKLQKYHHVCQRCYCSYFSGSLMSLSLSLFFSLSNDSNLSTKAYHFRALVIEMFKIRRLNLRCAAVEGTVALVSRRSSRLFV